MSGHADAVVLRNGRRLAAVDPGDRGLAYGDGLFETLRVFRGQPVWWDRHWSRLAQGAVRLGIPLPAQAPIHAESAALVSGVEDGVLKLVLTRGAGGRGYAPPVAAEATVLLSRHPPPPAPEGGLALRWCRTQLAVQPVLAGLKHCNRLEQVMARAEWSDASADEGLMCDTGGRAVCATAGNLFVRLEGRWLTPSVRHCGVAGIARGWLLEQLPGSAEAELGPDQVEAAEALFLCNAVRGILPVSALGARRWGPSDDVAAIRRRLAEAEPAFAARN